MLQTAVGPTQQSAAEREHLMRALLLITSPAALLYWKDYLGVDVEAAADTAAWMIRAVSARSVTPKAVTGAGGAG